MSVEWTSSFGGCFITPKRTASESVITYLNENGTYFPNEKGWFIEGWGNYPQPDDVESSVHNRGEMIVPCLGGLDATDLSEVFTVGFMGTWEPKQ